MMQTPRRLDLPEDAARHLLLAEAVDACDTQGKLLGPLERAAVDRHMVPPAGRADAAPAPDAIAVRLQARAAELLRIAGNRDTAVRLLAQRRPVSKWLPLIAMLLTLAVGALTDRVANPHRVDLLSMPLLTIVIWNVGVYTAIAVAWLMQLRRQRANNADQNLPRPSWASRLASWQPRRAGLAARVAATFSHNWYAATAALQAKRLQQVLHLAAAGWALGITLSLFARGLVVEYRVGWESTFLDAVQVQVILHTLLSPVLALFALQPFSVQEIAALRVADGAAGSSTATGPATGARWVMLYAGLLLLVVVAPRLLLALWARVGEWRLARRVTVPLSTPYYRRLIAMTQPTRINLGVIANVDSSAEKLLHALRPAPSASGSAAAFLHGNVETLLSLPTGELLCIARLPADAADAIDGRAAPIEHDRMRWLGTLPWARLRRNSAVTDVAHPATAQRPPPPPPSSSTPIAHDLQPPHDAVLALLTGADEIELAAARLRQLDLPVLLLIDSPALPRSPLAGTGADAHHHPRETTATTATTAATLHDIRTRVRTAGLNIEVLPTADFNRCWVQQPVLFDAIARLLPAFKKEGFTRLAAAHADANRARFQAAAAAIGRQLVAAANESEPISAASRSVTRLLWANDRAAYAEACARAQALLTARLQRAAQQTEAALLQLHGVGDTELRAETPWLADSTFRHSAPVNAREAGMAGAATGAATGASVDLITGGLTLGAAAALGALVGGGAALAGAVWKNRASPDGAALVLLSDDMLKALLNMMTLRYLRIVHLAGSAPVAANLEPDWIAAVSASLDRHGEALNAQWQHVRQADRRADPATASATISPSRSATPESTVTSELERSVQAVLRDALHTLYPAAPVI